MTAFDVCRLEGIRLKDYSTGEHRATCPKCSHLRKAHNRKVECLAVKITSEATLWNCHHCDWNGGRKNADETEHYRPPRNRRSSIRSAYR